jgi:hypothetical protein
MELLKIGTKVFDIRFGWGEVIEVNKENYAYKVEIKDGLEIIGWYTADGKCYVNDLKPMLSLTEYDLINGGFTPLSDYNKPQKFDVGYFWIDESHHELTYSQLIDIREDKFINSGFAEWTHFSKEVPEWFTKRINPKF